MTYAGIAMLAEHAMVRKWVVSEGGRVTWKLFGVLMRSEPEPVKAQLDSLVARLSGAGVTPVCGAASPDGMALYLHNQYPGDIGVWCVYFLNVAELKPVRTDRPRLCCCWTGKLTGGGCRARRCTWGRPYHMRTSRGRVLRSWQLRTM